MNEIADIPVETVIAKLRELAPVLKAEGVTRLALFGSRARGDARPDGGVDAACRYDRPRRAATF